MSEQLMKTFNELMAELEKSKAASNQKAQLKEPTEDPTPPECDGNYDSCDYYADADEITITPLEKLISDRITKHIKEGTFPTLEEAQAIHILDSINYRYNR